MYLRISSTAQGFIRLLIYFCPHFCFCLCCNLFTSKPGWLLEKKLLNSALSSQQALRAQSCRMMGGRRVPYPLGACDLETGKDVNT